MKNANDFMVFAETIMSTRVSKRVKKLINFKFVRHSRYNLNAQRLKQIESFIQKRVLVLLEMKYF